MQLSRSALCAALAVAACSDKHDRPAPKPKPPPRATGPSTGYRVGDVLTVKVAGKPARGDVVWGTEPTVHAVTPLRDDGTLVIPDHAVTSRRALLRLTDPEVGLGALVLNSGEGTTVQLPRDQFATVRASLTVPADRSFATATVALAVAFDNADLQRLALAAPRPTTLWSRELATPQVELLVRKQAWRLTVDGGAALPLATATIDGAPATVREQAVSLNPIGDTTIELGLGARAP